MKIEIVHLAALAVAVHAVSPEPEYDIGVLAAYVIFKKLGGASAVEGGAAQEVATFGFETVFLRLRAAGEGRDHRQRDQPRAACGVVGANPQGPLLHGRHLSMRWGCESLGS